MGKADCRRLRPTKAVNHSYRGLTKYASVRLNSIKKPATPPCNGKPLFEIMAAKIIHCPLPNMALMGNEYTNFLLQNYGLILQNTFSSIFSYFTLRVPVPVFLPQIHLYPSSFYPWSIFLSCAANSRASFSCPFLSLLL